MADAAPSYADRAAALIAELAHAQATSSPISNGTLSELKDLLDLGAAAQVELAVEQVAVANASKIAQDLKGEIADLGASIDHIIHPAS